MDGQPRDHPVGYGKPPAESRFEKGQSGNPGGRPRGTKKLVALLGEVLSQRSGLPNPDGSWMTKAEAIFFSLVNQASSTDLKAKSSCSSVLVKLQQANICFPADRLPETHLEQSERGASDAVSAEIDRITAGMSRDATAQEHAPDEQPSEARSEDAGSADPARMP